MKKIGIMQGRLLPMTNNRIQEFPIDNWEREFHLAKEAKLDCIEWIFEYPDKNPIFSRNGVYEIKNIIKETGVNVFTVCADHFMQNKMFDLDELKIKENIETFKKLIEMCSLINVKYIVLPCVDESEISSDDDKNELISSLNKLLPLCEKYEIKISLETSLPPQEFLNFIEKINHPNICINFDSGNSASLGFNPVEEISLLGKYFSHIHIKDRLLHGTTVTLGTGNTNFDEIFRSLNQIGYNGIFILQGARQEKEEIETIIEYRDFVKDYLNNNSSYSL